MWRGIKTHCASRLPTSVTVEVIGMIRFSFILDVTFFYDRTEKENTSVTVEVIGVIQFSFIYDVTFFYDRNK